MVENEPLLDFPSQTQGRMLINDIYLELGQQKENMTRIIELAEDAAESQNMEALKLIATNYPMVAARMLNNIDVDDQRLEGMLGEDLVQLYASTKKHLSFSLRKQILNKLIPFIINQANTIYRQGLSSRTSRYRNYEPGDPWDLEMTIEHMVSSGKTSPDYESIIVREPQKRKRSIVVCIDKSLSVLQLIHQIVLTAAVLALSAKKENFAIVEFDSKARVIKEIDQYMHPDNIVQLILDIDSGGKTNLEEAMDTALNQVNKGNYKDKVVYLISDLERTEGKDPKPVMEQISNLKVIYARTYRKIQFVEEVNQLPNVSLVELNRDSDLIDLTSKLLI